MSISVLAIVLFAASLHATWNAIVKGAGDKLFATIMVAGMAGLLAALGLPFLARPDPASWPFLAASACLQTGYFVLLARIYHLADMSQAYPLMRGTAPLLVSMASAWVIGERISPTAWVGIAVICCGIIGLSASSRQDNPRGRWLALGNAVVIAAYTLIDGLGVRRSAAPLSYTLWILVLSALPLVGWVLLTKRAAFGRYLARHLHQGAIGGFGTMASYGLALWAMTLAPVALVAALRETSILFATAISAFVLKEQLSHARIAMVCVIVAGTATLRLA